MTSSSVEIGEKSTATMSEQTTTYDDNGDLHCDNDITIAAGERADLMAHRGRVTGPQFRMNGDEAVGGGRT